MNAKRILTATLLATALAAGGVTLLHSDSAYAQKKEAAKGPALSPEMGKPLQAAQELLKAKKYKEALAEIQKADAAKADKTPYEAFVIAQMRAAAYLPQNDAGNAAKALEAMVDTGQLTPEQTTQQYENLTKLYYQAQNYGKSIESANKYYNAGGTNQDLRVLIAQAYFLQNDFGNAAKSMRAIVQAAEKAGRAPTEEQLQLLYTAEERMKNNAGVREAVEKLVQYYPSKDYWGNLLNTVMKGQAFSDRLELDMFRLMYNAGVLSTSADYVNMAQLSLQALLPAEAKTVIEKGMQAGILGQGAEADRHRRLLDKATKDAQADAAGLAQLEKEAEAAGTGPALVRLGEALASHGQYDKAISAMQRGIQKGGLKFPEDSKLRLGVVMLQAGKRADAEKVLKSVKGADGTAELARLWLLTKKA
ncbi:MAG TPA: hypothetical protein VEB20_23895 [Azospirillaceae bacterium]|nr:hypothetical protein [Azospirillaceae bacterium]